MRGLAPLFGTVGVMLGATQAHGASRASYAAVPPGPALAFERLVTDDTTDAASGATRGAAGGPWAVARDVNALAPEFRARLERVLERLREESGVVAEVVETRRSQSRQDALYEQGRTRPGPVVTWTRNSAHLGGYAADVVINGSYANGAAYSRLAAVAREEGLRTLGARDPGHVELPDAANRPAYASSASAFGESFGGTDAPAGSARALSRIVPSSGMAPSESTVFAASPYASVMSTASSFLRSGEAEQGTVTRGPPGPATAPWPGTSGSVAGVAGVAGAPNH